MRKAEPLGGIHVPKVEPGTRAFVVGNGPSLAPATLERLRGEVTFAMNRIHLIYPHTSWRPDFWLLMDLDSKRIFLEDIQIHAAYGYPCYVRVDILARWLAGWIGIKTPDEIVDVLKNVYALDAVNYINQESATFRDPVEDLKYNQGGGVGGALQLALAFGYGPVYLIGCDGNLRAGAVNHFTSNYDPDHATDPRNPAQIQAANIALDSLHTAMKREYDRRGVGLWNATPGSKISGTPSIDFDSLF